jgi:4a-hydroxytetrahydrobiopterin dehydratase
MSLAEQHIEACRRGTPALDAAACETYLQELPDWTVVTLDGVPQLQREFRCRDFAEALAFTNRIGALAEAADHHPAIVTEWGKVTLRWWTHVVQGLHHNDFVMAARCDLAWRVQSAP